MEHSNEVRSPDYLTVIKSVSKLVLWKLKSTTKNEMEVRTTSP